MKNANPNKYKIIDAIVTLLCVAIAALCIYQVEVQEKLIESGRVQVGKKVYSCKEIK